MDSQAGSSRDATVGLTQGSALKASTPGRDPSTSPGSLRNNPQVTWSSPPLQIPPGPPEPAWTEFLARRGSEADVVTCPQSLGDTRETAASRLYNPEPQPSRKRKAADMIEEIIPEKKPKHSGSTKCRRLSEFREAIDMTICRYRVPKLYELSSQGLRDWLFLLDKVFEESGIEMVDTHESKLIWWACRDLLHHKDIFREVAFWVHGHARQAEMEAQRGGKPVVLRWRAFRSVVKKLVTKYGRAGRADAQRSFTRKDLVPKRQAETQAINLVVCRETAPLLRDDSRESLEIWYKTLRQMVDHIDPLDRYSKTGELLVWWAFQGMLVHTALVDKVTAHIRDCDRNGYYVLWGDFQNIIQLSTWTKKYKNARENFFVLLHPPQLKRLKLRDFNRWAQEVIEMCLDYAYDPHEDPGLTQWALRGLAHFHGLSRQILRHNMNYSFFCSEFVPFVIDCALPRSEVIEMDRQNRDEKRRELYRETRWLRDMKTMVGLVKHHGFPRIGHFSHPLHGPLTRINNYLAQDNVLGTPRGLRCDRPTMGYHVALSCLNMAQRPEINN